METTMMKIKPSLNSFYGNRRFSDLSKALGPSQVTLMKKKNHLLPIVYKNLLYAFNILLKY